MENNEKEILNFQLLETFNLKQNSSQNILIDNRYCKENLCS